MKWILLAAALLAAGNAAAQHPGLIVHPSIRLPQDTADTRQLLSGLQQLLAAAAQPQNPWVLPAQQLETVLLLDEIKGLQQAATAPKGLVYQPHLLSVAALSPQQRLVRVAYLGTQDGAPVQGGSFELLAHRAAAGNYQFSSPLRHHTSRWPQLTVANNTFHYQRSINKAKVREFAKLAARLDWKLQATDKQCEFYLCPDFVAAQQLAGINYLLAYNGYAENTLSATAGNRKVLVVGENNDSFNTFDPHDLWHDRLSLVVPRKQVNRPVDEGYAYLVGGSWGISWPAILQQFRAKVAQNRSTDWAALKETPLNFSDNKTQSLLADYVVNALLLRQIEQEKGFAGVWELLNCGPYEKGNRNYYQALEKLTGITPATYNQRVWQLIDGLK